MMMMMMIIIINIYCEQALLNSVEFSLFKYAGITH